METGKVQLEVTISVYTDQNKYTFILINKHLIN